MRRHFVAALAAILFAATFACVDGALAAKPAAKKKAKGPLSDNDVIATVDNVTLRSRDLALVRYLGFPGTRHGESLSKTVLLDRLVEMALVVRYAEGKGLPHRGKGRETLELFYETTLGMEYAEELGKSVRYDTAEMRDWIPGKWRVASFRVVLFDSLDEAKAASASVRSTEDFEALCAKDPDRVKAFDNIYPKSGFFNSFDDVAIFNRESAGVYGAGETGIGPAVIMIREIREPRESEKEEIVRKATMTLREIQFRKETARIRSATPFTADKAVIRRYVESVRAGAPLDIPVASAGAATIGSGQIRHFVINEPVNYLKSSSVEDVVKAYADILGRLGDTVAFAAEARKVGRSALASEQYARSYENFRRKLLYETGIEDGVGPLPVSDNEVRDYYDRNLDAKYVLGERVDAAHFFSKEKKKADKALKRIKGGESFETVVREESEDKQSAPNGGRIGWILNDGRVIPEITKNAFKLKDTPGGISPVFKTKNGYHILKVHSYSPEETVPFEKAAPQIRNILKGERFEASKSAFLDGLRKNAEIRTYPDRVPDSALTKGGHR